MRREQTRQLEDQRLAGAGWQHGKYVLALECSIDDLALKWPKGCMAKARGENVEHGCVPRKRTRPVKGRRVGTGRRCATAR